MGSDLLYHLHPQVYEAGWDPPKGSTEGRAELLTEPLSIIYPANQGGPSKLQMGWDGTGRMACAPTN